MHAFVGASEQREAALAVCLTHLFAAVVTSERSHEVCVRCMLKCTPKVGHPSNLWGVFHEQVHNTIQAVRHRSLS